MAVDLPKIGLEFILSVLFCEGAFGRFIVELRLRLMPG